MDYVNLLLLVANLGLVIYALVRINALYVELRTPIVKKLSADLNLKPSSSRRPVGPQEMAARQGNNNRDNRNQPGNKDRQKDNRGERRDQQPAVAAPAQAPQGEAPRNRDSRENRENRDGRDRNRDSRDRNRDGRDRNRDSRDRNRRPQEMMGNEGGSEATAAEGAEAVVVERTESRPSFEGRRPLEPRFAPEAPVANESVAAVEAPAVEVSEAPEFDPSKMRHGRRNMIKKAPAFEDETTGETTNA